MSETLTPVVHDVTPMLRVDPSVTDFQLSQSVRLKMLDGERVVVPSDAMARQVLVLFGLTTDEADEQVRISRGPLP